ncbi:hypothetical protein HC251_14180 [Iamia sp. SCSIO 61187]|uniref:zinc ribbon domain-containing protein n=1 Tax=Iamia sp. SCSIO 61187 TaxID=2722752 RepID=UPI001C63A1E4|nr:zinc ribbon domain-containing protein [Iamia sp. SCSIO 61187]QYG93456.1 hypothetical protein HC251_14180 [Iamia sp. SCSIO 61187]
MATQVPGWDTCGLCGSPMHSRGRRDKPRYVCPPPRGCGKVSIDRPALDDWAADAELITALDGHSEALDELNRSYFDTAELTYFEWTCTRDALLLATEQITSDAPELLPSGFPPGR